MSAGLAARRAALSAVRAVEEHGAWSNRAVPAALDALADVRDRRFASHLAYETLRWRGTAQVALERVLTRPLAHVEPALQAVLRLGATQLLVSDVPARAAVDTSVRLAGEQVPAGRGRGAAGFVNGVLRALAREPEPATSEDPEQQLALDTGHPRWIVDDLAGRLDHARRVAVLEADNRAPGLTLRAVGDRDALVAELADAGVAAAPGTDPQAVRAPGADPRRLAAVAEGRAVPQDEASMRVTRLAGPAPGDRVLDLCAGPGGKTTHLASLVGPDGTVTAVERHPRRAELVRTAARGLPVRVVVADAGQAPVEGAFDLVLLDAPCTGLGTGRRRPEVRWRRGPADAASLADEQRRLLAAAARHVAPGGRLAYSVCTWTLAETEDVVAWFSGLGARHGLEPVERVQLWPDEGTDGMFVATWRRLGGASGG